MSQRSDVPQRSDEEVQEIERLYQERIESVLQGEVLPDEIEFLYEHRSRCIWQPLSSAQLRVLIRRLSTGNIRKLSLQSTHYCNTICFELGDCIFAGARAHVLFAFGSTQVPSVLRLPVS
jgi:hypothetical protein